MLPQSLQSFINVAVYSGKNTLVSFHSMAENMHSKSLVRIIMKRSYSRLEAVKV